MKQFVFRYAVEDVDMATVNFQISVCVMLAMKDNIVLKVNEKKNVIKLR